MVIVTKTLLVLAALVGGLGPAVADDAGWGAEDLSDLSFEELMDIPVYAASRNVQSSSEAPAFVTVVTRDEIVLFGDRTLGDILDRVAGFYVTDDRAYSYLGARGFSRPGDYNVRYLALVNGVRVNDGVYESFGSGREFLLNPEIIERLEIVRGASSSLYGTNAFFAVVNVVTRAPATIDGIEAVAEYGSHDYRQGLVTFGRRFDGGLEVVANGALYADDGRSFHFPEYDDPATDGGVTDPAADAQSGGNAYVQTRSGALTLQAGYSSRTKHVPTGAWETIFNDSRHKIRDRMLLLDARLEGEIFEDWRGVARVGLNRGDYFGDYPLDYADPGDPPYTVVNRDESASTTWRSEFMVTTESYRNQVLTLGAEARWNARLAQSNFDAEWPDDPYFDDERDMTVWGVFAQDEIRLSGRVRLSAGFRYDRYETFRGEVNPRLALVVAAADRTHLKAVYGKAFRAPNVYEMYYNDGGIWQKANPDLTPEVIRSFELIVDHAIAPNWHATLSGYRYLAEDLIEQMLDPADDVLQFRNIGEVEANGVDAVLEGRSAGGATCRLSVSHVRARDTDGDVRLTNSPETLVKLTITAPIVPGRLSAGLAVRHMSQRLDYNGHDLASALLTDLTVLAAVPGTRAEIRAGLYNLLDREVAQPVGDEHAQDSIPDDGRNARVALRFAF